MATTKRANRRRTARTKAATASVSQDKTSVSNSNRDVFINCPFDASFRPLFNAVVFTIIRCGFRARCALEIDDSSQSRYLNICSLIDACSYGFHDISRTETNGTPPLPRFNMPLELGLFLGAARHSPKPCIIFEVEQYSYQRYISDLAGQDIHHHKNDVNRLVSELANWLRTQSRDETVPGGAHVAKEAQAFAGQLPNICGRRMIDVGELTFGDLNDMIVKYIAETNRASLPI